MGCKPTQADCIVWAVQRLNHSATLSDQSSFIGYFNRTNKILKQRCSASNRIFFCSKQKNLSNQIIVRSKIELKSVYFKCNNKFSSLVLEQD